MQTLPSHSCHNTGASRPSSSPAPRVLCRAAAAAGQQHQHQQQRAALLYDFHDQLIPYDKVSVGFMLLVFEFPHFIKPNANGSLRVCATLTFPRGAGHDGNLATTVAVAAAHLTPPPD